MNLINAKYGCGATIRVRSVSSRLSRYNSMSFASYNDRKAIYTAVDAEAAEAALTAFEDSNLARQYPELAAEACLYLSK